MVYGEHPFTGLRPADGAHTTLRHKHPVVLGDPDTELVCESVHGLRFWICFLPLALVFGVLGSPFSRHL
jgi:hypothetical protein